MKKLALVVGLVSAVAFAADKAPPAAPAAEKGMEHKDMGMMMTPRKVTKEDKKGVEAAMDAMHKGWMSGDINALMANLDFPVFMMTDDKDGAVTTTMADADTYKKMMEPAMKAMAENKEMMAAMQKAPKPKRDMFFLTDTMVVVNAKGTMTMGKEKMEMRNTTILANKGGKWMVKGELEGGWGDSAKKMMEAEKAPEAKPEAKKPDAAPPAKK